MKLRIFTSLTLALVPLAAADPSPSLLTITATTPKVAIAARTAGRQFIELPGLVYHLLLEPRCDRGWEPRAITLSIADSRQVLDGSALDEHGFLRTSLAVPATQLAPLPVSGFCELTEDTSELREVDHSELAFKIPSALSVHAALICASADAERTIYRSRTLAVALHCDETMAVAPDQERPAT